ncbi:DegT/DnrJ/EryC1/StrS family aminotransferase [Acetohalobium arabaticum]|uniref:Glutamine--scyllo-inositol transaminase n=1 Tax=Acetohalobium arabaticum (strain ATCC 49924 / DSM 5501 / Z-7288) TaxID=574087 RepID=D9QTA2_ACEAZ|nr:DegT/DnrJ/EryC1/StrS family aminotransferase [Acetohalobium arabaticum]ADL13602.1 Glutamine--scyllo-inositol transaminase [Acetohalobium arabaticum DSM 5501]
MTIGLSGPDIGSREKELVNEVLESGWLSLGPKLEEFEEKFADYIGTDYAIGVNSGTSGLHLLIRALGIGEGDEVITTPFSFISSSNCILFEDAEPIFVDIDPETLCIDPDKIEAAINDKTKAILPVDVFGQPANMTEIMAIADKHDLKVIEDSCEAIGAEHKGQKVGTFADASVFAFYPNKQMTTGEGGVIVTDDEEIADLCRSMRNQGRGTDSSWLNHVRLGYNYRLDEMSCAVGIAQLERIEEILAKRAEVAEEYNRLLADVDEVTTLSIVEETTKMSWFVYVIQLAEGIDRSSVMDHLRSNDIQCKPYFTPIHLQPFYVDEFGYERGDFPITEQVTDSTIALPFYNNLTKQEIQQVVEILKEGIEKDKK